MYDVSRNPGGSDRKGVCLPISTSSFCISHKNFCHFFKIDLQNHTVSNNTWLMESVIICLIICVTVGSCFKHWLDRVHPQKENMNEEAWKKLKEIEDSVSALKLSKLGRYQQWPPATTRDVGLITLAPDLIRIPILDFFLSGFGGRGDFAWCI